jgi:hypothetical protein
MSEREELEAVIDAYLKEAGVVALDRRALAGNIAGRVLSYGYTKGNGELVEAVRAVTSGWRNDINLAEFDTLISSLRKALSDSEGVATSGGDDLRGPVAWLIADPDLMDESKWTIESDPAPESHGVSMPLHIHPGHAAAFDALIESAGSKRPYHAILAARSESEDTQPKATAATMPPNNSGQSIALEDGSRLINVSNTQAKPDWNPNEGVACNGSTDHIEFQPTPTQADVDALVKALEALTEAYGAIHVSHHMDPEESPRYVAARAALTPFQKG